MKEVKLVDSAQLNFNLRGETPDGTAYVARALGADVSQIWVLVLHVGKGQR